MSDNFFTEIILSDAPKTIYAASYYQRQRSSIKKNTLKYYIPAILWSLVILFLSTKGGINLPASWWDFIAIDKVGHLVVYGIFCMLILGAFTRNRTLALAQKGIIIALVVSITYGIGMEVIQYTFFPGRFFEIPDIIANIIGSFLGLYLFKRYYS